MKADEDEEGVAAGGFRAGRHFFAGQNENQSQRSPPLVAFFY
jgi:hypothetical protein